MSLIKLENMTPEVYTRESRDFQLLCRIYDCLLNCIKFDIDTATNIIDTNKCRTNMLSLLATKIGFFTDRKYNDDFLRAILLAFPKIIQYKGSRQSIIDTLNLYLKLFNLSSDINVIYKEETHHCIINVYEHLADIKVLEDIFRYILPFGITYEIQYNQNNTLNTERYYTDSTITTLTVEDAINSKLASNNREVYSDPFKDKYINQIGTITIVGQNNYNNATITEFDSSIVYNPWQRSGSTITPADRVKYRTQETDPYKVYYCKEQTVAGEAFDPTKFVEMYTVNTTEEHNE